MRHHRSGPRRTPSIKSYLRETGVAAIFALLALIAGVASDFTSEGFWDRHTVLAGVVSSVIVVILSVALINEVLERRRRQRWSVLAQYVMFELVRNARMIWLGMLDVVGLLATGTTQQESIDLSAEVVRDTDRLTAALCGAVSDDEARARLHREIGFLGAHADEVLGRWAAVMLNAEMYAEIIDPARRAGRRHRLDRSAPGHLSSARRRPQAAPSPQQSSDTDRE